jgi:hypothetical protein
MKARTGTNFFGRSIARLRQALLVLLMAAYVLVGFAGEISCAEESLGIPEKAISQDVASDKADPNTKKSLTVVDHCYTCAPLVIPVAAAVCAPASLSGSMSFGCSTIPALEPRLLDTPPPKSSI